MLFIYETEIQFLCKRVEKQMKHSGHYCLIIMPQSQHRILTFV